MTMAEGEATADLCAEAMALTVHRGPALEPYIKEALRLYFERKSEGLEFNVTKFERAPSPSVMSTEVRGAFASMAYVLAGAFHWDFAHPPSLSELVQVIGHVAGYE